jgi:hypothetical protein
VVRAGQTKDITACLVLAADAFRESSTYHNQTPNFERLVDMVLNDDSIGFFVSEIEDEIVGFMVAQLQHGLFIDDTIATNLVLYVKPAYRGMTVVKLITAFEDWGMANNVKQLHMGSSGGTNLESFATLCKGLGYQPVGFMAVKEV